MRNAGAAVDPDPGIGSGERRKGARKGGGLLEHLHAAARAQELDALKDEEAVAEA